ncbi:hypothetical protein DIKCMJMK_04316 [Shewanella oneidensis]|jgi:hypothetical protein|uniref:Uncharacterized protein n=1 Tax=Shewanella oneidensis (strain ATCC 700550 / JCM 31522 / CIP 106686 / LMG 19005 / NCIMB 14063 / MR-1) TaxID=211586 RepID=Q0KHM5_SHEON|nr:hypothetical protein SO_A0182 [Shewanella oneidensis MR-1]MEE2030406.1 hypothetical protein [Shewanella oneidensis]
MGKIVILSCSLLAALLMLFVAMSHDFGDFCIIRNTQFSCVEWDLTFLFGYIGAYLIYGALLGAVIWCLWCRCRLWLVILTKKFSCR